MKVVLITLLLGVVAKYIPGLKCITYCLYRKHRYKKATFKLMALFNSDSLMSLRKKEMITLYEQSTPFGCTALIKLSNQDEAREILKNMIAEKELLED